jgi:hypothetical protein
MAEQATSRAKANREFMMSNSRTVRFAAVIAFAAFSLANAVAAPIQPQAKGNFDGSWSVVIMTQKGDCDRAYRYPISINGGTVVNGGSAAFDISGKVSGDGSLVVRVSHGDKSAAGSGRLSADSGSGSWSGGACGGTWTAEKR